MDAPVHVNRQPFATVSRASMAAAATGGAHTRIGFSNPGIMAERTAWTKRHIISD